MNFKKNNDPENARETNIFSHVILWTIFLCLIIAFLWTKYAIVDEVTVGQGKVIPSGQVQVVQNLEGGIISEILVKQGDSVKKGQVIMLLDDTLFASKYNQSLVKLTDFEIELVRLEAEIGNHSLVFDPKLRKSNPELVASEEGVYLSHKKEKEQMQQDIDLAKRELEMTKPLVAKGAASPVEVLRLERTVSELQGKLDAYQSKTLEQYNETKGEYKSLQQEIQADQDRLTRTTIRSPVNGIVKQLKINTVGGVIKPGEDLLEIVPADDTLLIEAKIKPSDIGFIHPNQKVMVKVSAYDFSIYGGLEGIVENISADTIIDENDKKGESYYLVLVRTKKNHLGTEAKPLYIIPGMQTTVDILTGRKSILDYLLKPILKAKQSALRER